MVGWRLRLRVRSAVAAPDRVTVGRPARSAAKLHLPSQPTRELREVAAAWWEELAPSEQLVHRAAELSAEADDPSLFLPIAMLSRDVSTDVLKAAVIDVFAAADDAIVLTEDFAGPLALRWACMTTLDGRMRPQALCRWANRYSGWQGPDVFEVFEVLDLEYDEAQYAGALPSADLDERATSAAAEFLHTSAALVG